MALTGELSDLSLAELIEFFCNQRKTGRLKVTYAVGAGYFYLKAGSVIHAHFGDLRGIDAVYYALTQPNASFTFSPVLEAPEHSINQPWTSVVLEGLRRMDEGVAPAEPSPESLKETKDTAQKSSATPIAPVAPTVRPEHSNPVAAASKDDVQAFGVLLSSSESASFARRRWSPTMVIAAVVALVAIVGVPWGWYKHKNGVRSASDASAATPSAQTPAIPDTSSQVQAETVEARPEASPASDTTELAKRQREAHARERAKAEEGAAKPVSNAPAISAPPNKRATVTVTYDENGRVVAASGGDATALRIARQKRFPPGKPGSATVTIPIN